MAEDFARSRQYAYQQNSNLVLEADRESRRRPDEATGEVESLAGRISYRMGDRAIKALPPQRDHKRHAAEDASSQLKKKLKKAGSSSAGAVGAGDHSFLFKSSGGAGGGGGGHGARSHILDESLAFEVASYKPSNAQSQEAYEQILSVVAKDLGAQPGEFLAGAAEEVVAILKNDAYRDDEKEKEVTRLLRKCSSEEFHRLVMLGKRITDFVAPDESSHGDQMAATAGGEDDANATLMNEDDAMDKEMGVAVVFDEEDEEDESDLDEVRDDDDEDEEDDNADVNDQDPSARRSTGDGQGMRLKDADEDDNDSTNGDAGGDEKYRKSVQSIDAFWLQRELSKFYKDAEVSAKLAEDVLLVLQEAEDLSSCENKLVLLLDYDKFDFIKLLLVNRAKVLYCTRLKQAQSDKERQQIEQEMLQLFPEEGHVILKELAVTASADSWMQDRIGAMESTSRAEAKNLRKLQQTESMDLDFDREGDEPENASRNVHNRNNESFGSNGSSSSNNHATTTTPYKPQHLIDVESLVFQEGSHVMSNKECRLPEGTWRKQQKGYEEVHVPAVKAKIAAEEERKRIKIADLPKWTHAAFKNMESLNRVQSKMFEAAFKSSENLLLCAPTGAGKTNVAMLTILHEVMKARDPKTGKIDLEAFKIVYVAPMKALVQEVVLNLSSRLTETYGIQVRELSGDQNLSREQLFNTQIIVTTPEKWDIITRKSGDDRTYTQLVRLMIIDEIHLLHDTRGAVLEALVARTLRNIEATQQMVRLVGLSATLPNYGDVALFLRVDPDQGLFFFDASYRPVPLQQQYIGLMEKKALKRFALMNEICYEKVMEQADLNNQVLIFVHSRKETQQTAQALRDMCIENDTISKMVQPSSASSEILTQEAEGAGRNEYLKDLLPYGFGIHHAGMKREDRNLVEELFADGHLQVLVSTSTLAWGVNLPAHTVIIKGTQIYNAERGDWCELSPLDIVQMLGRAGRIQYDTQGEGIIITQHSQLKFYLSLMNQQLPVESQLLGKLADALNAEIVLGTVQSVEQAATWLGYTYLFVRMRRNPSLYGISPATVKQDPTLLQHRIDLAHSAATLLAKHNLIKYERRSGLFQVTALGRVASHYYIVHDSIKTYNEYLKPQMSDIELLRLFSLSNEFKYIVVRAEEKLELMKLMERVPVPIKEALTIAAANNTKTVGAGSAKVNVLLQAYISRLKLDGFALLADMVHVHQSAARIFRALFEICLHRGWATMAERTLSYCKMINKRMWLSHSPLRQFAPAISEQMLRRIEKKDISWDKYLDLEPADLGQLVNNPKFGKQLYKLIHQFPRLELSAHVQPITRSMLKVDLSITPDFEFVREIHGNSEGFWVLVEDVNGETILHYEWLLIKRRFASQETYLSFTMPLFEPLAPLYYVRVLSDRWIHSEATLPVSFHQLILPQKNPPPTELLDLQPLYVNSTVTKLVSGVMKPYKVSSNEVQHLCDLILQRSLQRRQKDDATSHLSMFAWHFKRFNPIQTQVLPRILESDGHALVASSPGSGKSAIAELAVVKKLLQHGQLSTKTGPEPTSDHLVVYLAPKQSVCDEKFEDWNGKFGETSCWQQRVALLTGDATADLRLLATSNLLIGTPEQWDMLSRRWKQRKRIQQVSLLVADDVHFVGGGEFGPTMEVVLSRMRFIAADLEKKHKGQVPMRILALSNPIANARDVGEWIGAKFSDGAIYNFHPNVRPQPLEIRVQGFEINDFSSRMLAMSKPVYNSIVNQASNKPVLVFVPSGKQAQLSAIDLITFALADNEPLRFLQSGRKHAGSKRVSFPLKKLPGEQDDALLQTLNAGVGYLHDGMGTTNRALLLELFHMQQIQVLVVPHSMCWHLKSAQIQAFMVSVMGTQFYDGKEHRYVDYQLADVYQMTKFANRPHDMDVNGAKCCIFCHASKKKFYAKFLYDPLPVESQLEHFLSDHMNAEIVTKIIETKQDAVDYLTWTLMYRRLMKNPNYYNLLGATNVHLSDHLSELVETTVNALEESRCIQVTEEEDGTERLSPLNLGMIAAYYYIKYTTIELFACSLTVTSKLKALVNILASATEFADLPSRFGEEAKLEQLAKHLKYPMTSPDYSQPHVKANVLLQVHFSKQHDVLGAALRKDLDLILRHAVRLIHAMVDVISSNGWLRPALAAMDLAQMVVQAQWNTDSPLVQVPLFSHEILDKIKQLNAKARDEDDVVETPLDILSMEESTRQKLLPFDKKKMSQIATFCNAYPDVNVKFDVEDKDEITTGSIVTLRVSLERETDDDDEDEEEDKHQQDEANDRLGLVNACHYPVEKAENWWVVVGDSKSNTLLSIKRVPLLKKANLALEFNAPESEGSFRYQLYVICDGYAGCDLENEIDLQVSKDEDDDDEEDGEGEEAEEEEEE